jgi:hypothetical protein
MSRSLSSGARSRDPLAYPGYACSDATLAADPCQTAATRILLVRPERRFT